MKQTSIIVSKIIMILPASGSPKQAKSAAKNDEKIEDMIIIIVQMYIILESWERTNFENISGI